MRTVFLDLETTGLSPKDNHKIIEIGAVAYQDKEQIAQFHRYVKPERDIDADALKVHGITLKFLADQPIFAVLADEVLEFLDGADLHAHNASFDVGFLDAELGEVGKGTVENIVHKITDTLDWANRMFPGRSNSLDALAKRAGMDVSKRREKHSAIEDAKILAEIYFYFSGGQSSLDLRATEIDIASMPNPQKIKRHLFKHSDEISKRHQQFVAQLEEESKVKQLLRK